MNTKLYTIFNKKTTDQPGKMVLRQFAVQGEFKDGKLTDFQMIPGEIIHLGDTLAEMRRHLPSDAKVNLGVHHDLGEDPNIVESWGLDPKPLPETV